MALQPIYQCGPNAIHALALWQFEGAPYAAFPRDLFGLKGNGNIRLAPRNVLLAQAKKVFTSFHLLGLDSLGRQCGEKHSDEWIPTEPHSHHRKADNP